MPAASSCAFTASQAASLVFRSQNTKGRLTPMSLSASGSLLTAPRPLSTRLRPV